MADLSAAELEVMGILWRGGPLKPAEIQARLGRAVKNSALRWQLGVMVERGHLARERRGKAFYYRANVLRQGAFREAIRRLAETFFRGSMLELATTLVESGELSEEELRALRKAAKRIIKESD